jgi:hypothetical protein
MILWVTMGDPSQFQNIDGQQPPLTSASATQMASGTSEARCFAAYSLCVFEV